MRELCRAYSRPRRPATATEVAAGRGRAPGVQSAPMTASKAEGQRVVLGRRDKFNTMVPFHWSDEAPPDLNDLEWAEELGARWEGDELVTYDYPSLIGLLEYYEKGEYLPDND